MVIMNRRGASRSAAPTDRPRLTAGLWTLLLIAVVLVTAAAAPIARVRGLEHGILVASVGLAIGLLMGSPQMRLMDRAVVGVAVGGVGTISGVVLSALISVLLETSLDEVIGLPLGERDLQPEIFVASIACVLGVVNAGTCALGAVVGGFLRGRIGGRRTAA